MKVIRLFIFIILILGGVVGGVIAKQMLQQKRADTITAVVQEDIYDLDAAEAQLTLPDLSVSSETNAVPSR